ncbi:hypothetical protein KRE40_05460 [Elizabethkingia meningoseptica]|uniref:hypothetical protein n=1 Tax=Elizabethkingia meningoseptica TaxID=238 RepID=UPI000999FB82|nr:hypothetical protein [Elizabethkingia meningoseptica]MDE5429767.1 hypothetical protein [Elizabethkingia meningoseptica]MDE5436705.1 hypothetical protein [Elizabethkingia meningoseptica]MDE5508096.1 hypothetical protein [Elizabethkingia meningoseptica]MDE5514786.1 hypothetical protein [Elizabethkingia meningoseptica]MDE5525472.1 hypothetical protein [Elizabethkingia meningoseptica]
MKIQKENTIHDFSILIFVLKIWITTSTIPAFLIQLFNHNEEYSWSNLLFISGCGLLLSVPSMTILAFVIKIWTHKKLFLILISIFLVFTSFCLAGFNYSDILFPVLYSVIISGAILIIDI